MLGSLKKAREWAMPTLKSSAFLEKGVLTPDEFVLAGDELVFKCPTWAWEGGDPDKSKSYLPLDKQYLITRNVPCQNRVSSMETAMKHQDGEGDEDDWLISSLLKPGEQAEEDDDDGFDILDGEGEVIDQRKESDDKKNKEGAGEEEDDYADMAAFEDDNVLEDNAAAAPTTAPDADDAIIKVRTYDLSITYDKYYQTPRVWMIGRNTDDQPLTGTQMMEDVISDYANKTVTMESHPHVSGPHASIHPCQHGKVMKAIVKNLLKKSSNVDETKVEDEDAAAAPGPSVEIYLFIFLKFVSSMIPTINYDFTMDVMADTSK